LAQTKVKIMYSENYGGKRAGSGRKPKGKEKRIKVSFTLNQEIKEALENKAKEKNISQSDFLNQILQSIFNL